MSRPSLTAADDHLLTAELLKQLGDARAAEFYEKAIAAEDEEPVYELLYADYLRNFRGPRRPLFGAAAAHYLEALRKQKAKEQRDGIVTDRIDRGLVALYQEDGVPLMDAAGAPSLFLTSIYRSARSTADLDEVHDTRDFTSEALFASSGVRLNRPLTPDELRGIVRLKEPVVTLQRLRWRVEDAAFDFFYQGRRIETAQITNFFLPNAFNDVTLHTFGGAFDFVSGGETGIDVYWRFGAAQSSRKGVVEFDRSADETLRQLDFRTAVSRFIGPDKANVEIVYVSQTIEPKGAQSPPDHNRHIAAVTGEYQILRPLPFLGNPYGRLFALRGIHLRGGVAADIENFGPTRVSRFDYFAGATVNGLGPFDVSVQPAIIQSRVGGDPHQTHSHLRTDAAVVMRLLDEERQPGIPRARFLGFHPAFVHLSIPLRKDTTRDGLDAFENDRIGAALTVKFFRRALSPSLDRVRPATVLASARYDRQRFPRLDRTERLLSVSVGVGY